MTGYLGVWGGLELTSLKLSSTPLFLLIYLAKFLLKKKKKKKLGFYERERERERERDIK